LDTIPAENDKYGVQDLVDIELNGNDPNEIEESVRSMEGIEFTSVSTNEGTKVKMIVGTSSCLGCRALAEAEAFLLYAKVLKGGWVEWKVVHEDMDKLENLRKNLDKAGMPNKIISIRDYRNTANLSVDQDRVLRTAMDMGYFNFPKSVGVRELAKRLGVSTAYISYTLRSAQKKTIELYFKR
jgi:predicted DNA binding protein